MGIKRNIAIAAEIMETKASRLQAMATMQQATRELLQDNEVRPSTRKPKKGVQGAQGRTRVERAREERFVTVTLSKGHYWVDLDIEI